MAMEAIVLRKQPCCEITRMGIMENLCPESKEDMLAHKIGFWAQDPFKNLAWIVGVACPQAIRVLNFTLFAIADG
eukprot:scaffold1137_cov392-Pavlova_lutheri.AAC.6